MKHLSSIGFATFNGAVADIAGGGVVAGQCFPERDREGEIGYAAVLHGIRPCDLPSGKRHGDSGGSGHPGDAEE